MLTATTRLTDFPSLEHRTYLNTAAEGIPPQAVIKALHQYAEDKILGMDGRIKHEAKWAEAKAQIAAVYGLTADEIGICSCSSEAYNLVRMALQLQDGDEVVINDLDFPAGATPWLQASCPAAVKVWRSREGALRVEDLIPLLSKKTRLVNVSMVSFFNGFKIPLDAVRAAVRGNSSALIALDVTQALGRVPLDLTDIDLIISSTHKWILSSHGGGLVGVPKARAEEWTVPAGGWFNIQAAFDDDRFDRPAVSKPGADSFTVGMPNYAAVYAINAGLSYIRSVGVAEIAAHADPLVRACIEGLSKLPVELITPNEPESLAGIISFRHPDADAINARLHEQDIHIMGQAGRLRVAIHGYNTAADIDRLLATLTAALS